MTDVEIWESLESQGYPNYSISSWGRVLNDATERPMAISKNQQGFAKLSLMTADGTRRTVQINHLVINAFGDPQPSDAFDSLIHLDGNKDHTFIRNLAWRPRWFALSYHAQFIDRGPFVPEPIVDLDTEEIYFDSRYAARKHGLLEKDIFLSTVNHSRVFPTGQTFRLVRNE